MMTKSIACMLALAATLAFSGAAFAEHGYRGGSDAPPPRHAEFGEPYLFGHLGIFEPDGDITNYNSGSNVDVGLGSRVTENIAIEASLGRYAASSSTGDITVWPMTFGARLILPQPIIEPYAGLGLGFYRVNMDDLARFGVNDSNTAFGGYLSLGADAWLNPRTALNFEGRYQIVDPQLSNQHIDLSGWTVSLGIRVGF